MRLLNMLNTALFLVVWVNMDKNCSEPLHQEL